MHQKSVAGHWQHYLQSRLSAALTGRTAWLLFGLAFIAVYREVFATILFYIALWNQGHNGALLLGLLAGAGTLALIAVLMLRYSRRLPIGQVFTWGSVLVTVLAVGVGASLLWVPTVLAAGGSRGVAAVPGGVLVGVPPGCCTYSGILVLVEPAPQRRAAGWSAGRRPHAGADRGAEAALQPPSADRQVLPLQFGADHGAGGGV